ncbi:hypothetical protein LWI28_017203 [Acer negundo]|uniref:Protein yippee-like n=1 Tax=Acer negundo TaxID=4023 RepID=A0AAD5I9U8_ACENE|nr:hypothetical protein LWI28_017203 [Acer negundo]
MAMCKHQVLWSLSNTTPNKACFEEDSDGDGEGEEVVSGKAYMFTQAMNISLGRPEERMMISGVYTIANINCSKCGEELGWKYLRAHNTTQKYKEGNFVLERVKMIKDISEGT